MAINVQNHHAQSKRRQYPQKLSRPLRLDDRAGRYELSRLLAVFDSVRWPDTPSIEHAKYQPLCQLLFERHPNCFVIGKVDVFCSRRDRFEVLREDPIEV